MVGLHVAFHPQVATHIRVEPGLGIRTAEQPVAEVESECYAAGQVSVQQFTEISRRGDTEHLRDRQRIERQHRNPSRQGLAHSAHQREVL